MNVFSRAALVAVLCTGLQVQAVFISGGRTECANNGNCEVPAVAPPPTSGPKCDDPGLPVIPPNKRTFHPSSSPSVAPSAMPSPTPSAMPTGKPSGSPSKKPSATPSSSPTADPSSTPSSKPSSSPSSKPSNKPSTSPSSKPSATPSSKPSAEPTAQGERSPSETPSVTPSQEPTKAPIDIPISDCPEKAIDICIAIDYSGSVCTTPNPDNNAYNCYPNTNCENECTLDLGAKDWCPNFREVKSFATSIIETVHGIGGSKQFSLVTFSDVDKTVTKLSLTDSLTDAVNAVANVEYLGGWTNTGGAIAKCHATLENSDNEKVIMLLTDGYPTTGDSSPLGYAQREALAAMEAGILMLPMYINTVSTTLVNMESFTNDPGNVVQVQSFEELPTALGELLGKIGCDDPTFEPGNLIDPCSSTFDDFSEDGFSEWIVDGGASMITYSKWIDGHDLNGSLRLQGVHSDTHITKKFDDEIAAMTEETLVSVKFNACFESVEQLNDDDLYLKYNTGDGWVTAKTWLSADLSYSSNVGCYEGEEVKFSVGSEVSTLEIRFEAITSHSSDLYYISQVNTDICSLPECEEFTDTFTSGDNGWDKSATCIYQESGWYNGMHGYMKIPCPNSDTHITKTLSGVMPYPTTLTIGFDYCYENTEVTDSLQLLVNSEVVGTWHKDGNNGVKCESASREVEIPANTPVEIKFKTAGTHSGEYFYIDNVDVKRCKATAAPQCVAVFDDKFDTGNEGWYPSSNAQWVAGNTSDFSAMYNYMKLSCPSSSSSIIKTFNQVPSEGTTLSIDFDFCWKSTETADKLELWVAIDGSWGVEGTWRLNGNNGNHGCKNGARQVAIPANTGQVKVKFKATGSTTNEWFYIDRVRTEWCETGACPLKVLDFNTLKPNTYVHDLQSEYGVTVTVNGGWQGNGGDAMVFDTTRPTGHFGCDASDGNDGDPDLGAPNLKCPGGGPGRGKWVNGIYSGSPQSSHPNCEHVGNVLIIQETNKSPNCPDDTSNGGTIVFEFDHADGVTMEFAGLLDTDHGETPKITGMDVNGNNYPTLQVEETGDNGYTKEAYSYSNVKKVTILYDGSGSIAELGYRVCPV